jgi:hypothetical protein
MFWTTDTAAGYIQVNMSNVGDTFRANIPAQQLGTRVYYYISATSVSGKTVNKPLPAPRGNIQFLVTNLTGVVQNNNNVPGKFALYQNYPNPFNPVTKIKFDIQKLSYVSLKIYDITGREVSALVNSQMAPGSYSYVLNASHMASGVYFYRLQANGFTDIKKMILIK